MMKETRFFFVVVFSFLFLTLLHNPLPGATHAFYEGSDSSLIISTSSAGSEFGIEKIVVTTSFSGSSNNDPAITVDIPETLDDRYDKDPVISINPKTKEIVIIWSRMDIEGNDFEIAGCTYNFGEWSNIFYLTNNDVDDDSPTVTHDLLGGIHIAWRTLDSKNSIYYAHISPENNVELKVNLSEEHSIENGPPELLVSDHGYPYVAFAGRLPEGSLCGEEEYSIFIFSSWKNLLGQGAQDIPTLLRVTDVSLEKSYSIIIPEDTLKFSSGHFKIHSTMLNGKPLFYWMTDPNLLYFSFFKSAGKHTPQNAVILTEKFTLTDALEMIRLSMRELETTIAMPEGGLRTLSN